ncbi:MAG TPA: AzlC family ABC transporter permease [Dongiaceae bacterium]|nr:AzlC family ABC transporter permease [Dongiaceae bacterium]
MSGPGEDAGAARSRLEEFAVGLRDTLPLMMGSIAFGVIFGTLATTAGLSAWQTMAMSLFVFSGSAQFIAILLLGSNAGLGAVWFATLVLNLRHLLYAATLVDEVRHLSQAWRFPLAAFLTDETFAVMERRYRTPPSAKADIGPRGGGPNAHWYYVGSCAGMYVNWQFWTAMGIVASERFEELKHWGLEFAMVVSFIGIVMPLLNTRPYWAATIVAGVVSVAANPLPYKLGLMLGALAGIAVGLALDLKQRGLRPPAENPLAPLTDANRKTWA